MQPPLWPGAPPRVTVVVSAERVTSRGRTSGAVGQVLVVGTDAWTRVPYRARVEVTGRASADALRGRTVAVVTTTAAPVVVGRPPAWARGASAVRSDVRELADGQPGDAGALLAAIAVGDTGRVPTDLTAALRTSGLTHVTAVSGAHFSLVVALVLALATAARAPRWVRAVAALVATAGTVALVHPDPSVQRAAAMGLVAVLGLVTGRRAQAPAALATGVVVLLVLDPWLGGEIGFLLSVLATGGLVLAGRPLAERWAARLGRAGAEALALPVAAQLCCAPVLLVLAPTVSTYAVPANVLAAAAVGPATVLGLLAGLVDPLCAPLARGLAACAGAACWWVGAVARLTSAMPGARADWLDGRAGLVTLALAAAATLTLLLHRRPR
ncbi:ComEC/Rec2 family competence protein [Cellulomonas alba]|uniref:ComEC/Rec2 family competence protein n=1 Tax=Cellulomonas alba TaxID=3053467 RepID=A0ABT7SC79_9CELL|nr:ComEC/Rec2 family competence protein [Cellulomonas alba]MDM7853796.1 ComEC/Rec2 family competence protein [Cellulomonas alba]